MTVYFVSIVYIYIIIAVFQKIKKQIAPQNKYYLKWDIVIQVIIKQNYLVLILFFWIIKLLKSIISEIITGI